MEDTWNWRKIRENDRYSEIEHFYTADFPIEVRCLLATFLARDISFMKWNPDNPTPQELRCIYEFIDSLKTALGQIFDSLPCLTDTEFFYKKGLRSQREHIQNQSNDLQLFKVIWKSLSNEQRLMLSRECGEDSMADRETDEHSLLNFWKAEIDGDLTINEQKCEGAVVRLTEIIRKFGSVAYQIVSPEHIQRESTRLQECLQIFQRSLLDCIQSLESVRTKIMIQLNAFKDHQRFVPLAIRPKESDTVDREEVDELQDFEQWFRRVAYCITRLEQKLEEYEKEEERSYVVRSVQGCARHSFGRAKIQIAQLRNDFLRECLVIQKQPAQIIRNENNFGEIVLRLLPCTARAWNIKCVKAVFIKRDAALHVAELRQSEHFTQGFLPEAAPGELICEPVFQDSGNTRSNRKGAKTRRTVSTMANIIRFPNVRVKKVKKGRKNAKSESVVERKYWMYFRVGVTWFNNQTHYLHVLSQPLCTTKHTSQEAKAWASLIWFNSFPMNLRTSNGIDVPNEIQWNYLIDLIDQEFIHLGRKLSKKQKTYLRGRMLNDNEASENVSIRKSQFCKHAFPPSPLLLKDSNTDSSSSLLSSASSSSHSLSPIPSLLGNRKRKAGAVAGTNRDSIGRGIAAENKELVTKPKTKETNISHGEWLYYCINILNPNTKNGIKVLSTFWKEGKIMGFIGSHDIEKRLKSEPSGTFLIRFPENRPNRIGLYFYSEEARTNSVTKECLVKLLYKLQDFHLIPLEERILMNKDATYVYSNYLVDKQGRNCNSLKTSDAFEIGDKEKDDITDGRGYIMPRERVVEYFSGVFRKMMQRKARP